MNRKTFIKSLCLIALAPMAAVKALGRKPEDDNHQRHVELHKHLAKHWPEGGTGWVIDHEWHMQRAKVYGYRKDTGDITFISLEIPESELDLLGKDAAHFKARMIDTAKRELMEQGCVPL